MKLADRVRVLCALAKTPLSRISELSGLSRGALPHIARGFVASPSAETLDAVARVTGCSLDWLVRGEGDLPRAEDVRAAVALAESRHAARPQHGAVGA